MPSSGSLVAYTAPACSSNASAWRGKRHSIGRSRKSKNLISNAARSGCGRSRATELFAVSGPPMKGSAEARVPMATMTLMGKVGNSVTIRRAQPVSPPSPRYPQRRRGIDSRSTIPRTGRRRSMLRFVSRISRLERSEVCFQEPTSLPKTQRTQNLFLPFRTGPV